MSSDDEKAAAEPAGDPKQLAIEVAAFATSAISYVGGPISNILSGVGTVRRIKPCTGGR